jgi:transposase-like protein
MKRKSYEKAFKARVALEAIKEESTIQELANKYQVHSKQISEWKKQLLEGADVIFERPNKKLQDEAEKQNDLLLQTVGKMKIENIYCKLK